jgi:hypothetical protein
MFGRNLKNFLFSLIVEWLKKERKEALDEFQILLLTTATEQEKSSHEINNVIFNLCKFPQGLTTAKKKGKRIHLMITQVNGLTKRRRK